MSDDSELAAFSGQPSALGHYIFFYDNDVYKFNVLFDFLRAGLRRRQTCIYHNPLDNRQRLLRSMRKFGLDPYKLETRILVSDESTIIPQVEAALATGKTPRGLRLVSNAQEYLYRKNKPSQIVEQEQTLDELILHRKVSVLCAYDSRWFNRPSWFRVFPPIIRLHNQAAFASRRGTAVMRNLNTTGNRSEVALPEGA